MAVSGGQAADPPQTTPVGISDDDVIGFADGHGISEDTAAWLLGDGGAAILDVQEKLRNDEAFGAIWVEYRPFRLVLRLTSGDNELESDVTSILRHEFETIVDEKSLSYAALERERAAVVAVLEGVPNGGEGAGL
jgi:hypothetical protein